MNTTIPHSWRLLKNDSASLAHDVLDAADSTERERFLARCFLAACRGEPDANGKRFMTARAGSPRFGREVMR